MDRRCRTGEIIDFFHFDKEWEGDVVTHQLEARVADEGARLSRRLVK